MSGAIRSGEEQFAETIFTSQQIAPAGANSFYYTLLFASFLGVFHCCRTAAKRGAKFISESHSNTYFQCIPVYNKPHMQERSLIFYSS